MLSSAQRRTEKEAALIRATGLVRELAALEREQGLLVAELVWNEMRVHELRARLERGGDRAPAALARELERRLRVLRSLARWEAAADLGYRRLSRRLGEILTAFPELVAELGERGRQTPGTGLPSIARGAAAELGIDAAQP